MRRHCSIDHVKPWLDSNQTVRIRWYVCPPGTKALPYWHTYQSPDWQPQRPKEGPDEEEAGVYPYPTIYDKGRVPDYIGTNGTPCGSPQAWRGGLRFRDPALKYDLITGVAKCCGVPPALLDPLELDGRIDVQSGELVLDGIYEVHVGELEEVGTTTPYGELGLVSDELPSPVPYLELDGSLPSLATELELEGMITEGGMELESMTTDGGLELEGMISMTEGALELEGEIIVPEIPGEIELEGTIVPPVTNPLELDGFLLETIYTDCCPGGTPSLLFIDITDCDCIESPTEIPLNYNGSGPGGAGWYSDNLACGEKTIFIGVRCLGFFVGWTAFIFEVGYATVAVQNFPFWDCGPLDLAGTWHPTHGVCGDDIPFHIYE